MAGFGYTNIDLGSNDRGLVSIVGFDIGGLDEPEMRQLTIKEITLGESLLTPGLQTAVTFQNSIYLPAGKNFDKFKNKQIRFTLSKQMPDGDYSMGVGTFGSPHVVYRMEIGRAHV